jgi:hypothetical protein
LAAIRIFRRLAELLDVAVSSPTDGQVLTYDTGTSKWRNEAAGNSGSLPSQWTIGANGELEIETGANDATLRLIPSGGQAQPVLEICDVNGDPFIQLGGDAGNTVGAIQVLVDSTTSNVWFQVFDQDTTSIFSFDANGEGQFALANDGHNLLTLYPTATSAEWNKLIRAYGPDLTSQVFFVFANGQFGTAANAPLDVSTLGQGWMVFWFDKVASKMMVQARLDDLTEVTGELVLTP